MGHPACDFLIEMLPPTSTWGTEYVTFPFEPARRGGDLWRAFALEDSTDVILNDTLVATINVTHPAHPFYETDNLTRPALRTAAHWQFSKPVMLCQYITGQTYDNSDHGDPSFVVLESRGQFEKNTTFATPPDANGFTNYINVVIDGKGQGLEDSLRVDGRLIDSLPAGYTLAATAAVPGNMSSGTARPIAYPLASHRLISAGISSMLQKR